jgi:hypothetical protein
MRLAKVTTFLLAFAPFACQLSKREISVNTDEKFGKLFAHYQGDSLKLTAARFLVDNIAGKQTEQLELFYSNGTPFRSNAHQDYRLLKQKVDSLNLFHKIHLEPDIDHIGSDYLIENIDQAFEQWQASPWKTQFTFDQFCEYVLPYRIGTEHLEDWRRVVQRRFPWVNDSLKKSAPLHRIICLINDSLESDFHFGVGHLLNDNALSASQLLKYNQGGCDAMANAALFSMRAFAIPVMKDFTPAWASANGGHSWNSIYIEPGKLCSFMGCESCPDPANTNYYFPFDNDGKKVSNRIYHRSAKVFRYSYSVQPIPFAPDVPEEVPPFFKANNCIKDVTSEYMPTAEIRIALDSIKQKVVYACVFNSGKWVPVCWAYVSETYEAVFKNMGKDIVYLVAVYENGMEKPVSDPFLFTENGEVKFLVPGSLASKSLLLKDDRSLYHPKLPIETGKIYSLVCWKNDSWTLVTKKMSKGNQIHFDNIPVNGLYQLRSSESYGVERPFVFSENCLTWY